MLLKSDSVLWPVDFIADTRNNSMDSEPADDKHSFTVVIPAWNESALLSDTIETAKQAIEQQNYSGQLIVVDNNSTDDTAHIARQAGAQVVFEPINQIARARNTGANAAHTPWLVFLDADTLLNPTLLSLALDALASDTVIGGGTTIVADRPVGLLASKVINFWNWVSVKSNTAAGCFIYCRQDAFDEIGGFDTKVYAGEELHLSRKLRSLARRRGMRFVIQTTSPISTSARKLDWFSTGQMIRQCLFLLIPFATHSKRLCGVWYKRENMQKPSEPD